MKGTRSTSRPRQEELPPDTRSRILQVAGALIAERGNAAISLVDVAAAAGVSRQTLYLLFGSRAGLLLAMVDQIDEASGTPRRLTELRETLPAQQAFEPYLRAWFDYLPVVLPIARALAAAATAGDEDARAAWVSRMNRLRGGIGLLTAGLHAAKRLKAGWTPQTAADWIFASTHVDTWQHLVVDAKWTPAEAVERIIGNLRATLIVP
jgi:AcrR family transcriptional regulator